MENLHVMSEEKRHRIFEGLRVYEKNAEEEYKRKLEKEKEMIAAKKKIVVKTVFDLREKYDEYDIDINGFYKTAILKKPIDVKYYIVFRAECERLGYKCGVEEK
ncbi:MAG: hypothetical protein PUJ51_22680 [Clostridiales bacterium]|uniref:hypothetical protein n=1 Tax=Terrisporobacter sp. TaxID=1965305 RepID=UPI002A50B956|nr:hypothetical protein [Terrisporobacter sp.]MDD7757257.1 hypothetical protein [Clostridiales bacterium]MDY4134309.1 hypothetical protein [Terrisporobacter sp.]